MIEVFISRQVKQCYKEFAKIHGVEKKDAPKTSKYKEKKGSYIQELLLKLPDIITEVLAVEFLTYLANKLKKEFEKLIKEKSHKKKDNNNDGGKQTPKQNETKTTIQVKIGKLIVEDITIIVDI